MKAIFGILCLTVLSVTVGCTSQEVPVPVATTDASVANPNGKKNMKDAETMSVNPPGTVTNMEGGKK
jgi:hypothetical protein